MVIGITLGSVLMTRTCRKGLSQNKLNIGHPIVTSSLNVPQSKILEILQYSCEFSPSGTFKSDATLGAKCPIYFVTGPKRWERLRWVMVLLLVVWLSQSLAATTLPEAIHQTLISNPDILSAKAKEQAAYQDILQARGRYYPTASVSAGIGKEYTSNPFTRQPPTTNPNPLLTRRESQWLLSQLLYDGGNVRNTLKQRTFDWKTSQYQLAEIRENLAFLTAAAYLDVLRHHELIAVAKQSVESHRQTVSNVNKLYLGGAGTKTDLELAQGRLAFAQSNLDEAQGRLANAQQTYLKLVGAPPAAALDEPQVTTDAPISLVAAQRLAMQFSPAVQAAVAELESLSAAVGVAESAFYPRVHVDLSDENDSNLDGLEGNSLTRQAMLRVTYPIFNGGSDLAAVNAAVERKRQGQYVIASVQRQVNEQVGFAWNQQETTQRSIPLLAKYAKDSLEVFQGYKKQYQLGQRTLFDLLNAETEHYDALGFLINARFDEKTAHYQLLAVMGNLVSTMAVLMGQQVQLAAASAPPVLLTVQQLPPILPMPLLLLPTPPGAQSHITLVANDKQTQPPVVSSVEAPTPMPAALAESDQYTIQLMASQTQAGLDRFIAEHHLQGQVQQYRTVVNGQNLYRLVYGNYDSLESALQALDQLPIALKNLEPMVRTLAYLQTQQ